MHFTRSQIIRELESSAKGTEVTVQLGVGDTAWSPESTRGTARIIVGPGYATYARWPRKEIRVFFSPRDY